MYQGRYQNSGKTAKKPVRRRKLNKYFLVTLSLFLLLGVAGGATLAYIVAQGETVENSFTPGVVQCEVQKDDVSYSVKNTGTVNEFIRVAVVVNWETTDGSIYAFAPVAGTDYTIAISEYWREDGGYYYYLGNTDVPAAVPPGDTVTLGEIKQTKNDGVYDLCIEVLAEAIQAEGMGEGIDTAQEAWEQAVKGIN